MSRLPPEKTIELEKHYAIAEAMIDYFSERDLGSFVCDGIDPLVEIYGENRRKLRKYLKRRRLDLLQKKTDRVIYSEDDPLAQFIKKKTGYEMRITPSDFITPDSAGREIYRETVTEGDWVTEHVVVSTGGNKNERYLMMRSPDNLKTLSLSTYVAKSFSCTTIHLQFPKGSGPLAQINSVIPEISASWKDNQTIVIRTGAEIDTPIRVNKVESHGELINIEYEDI